MIRKHNPQGFVSGYAFFQNKKDVNMGCPREKLLAWNPEKPHSDSLYHGPSGDRWTAPVGRPAVSEAWSQSQPTSPRSPSWPPDGPPRLPRGIPLCSWLGAPRAEGQERGG